MKRKLIFHKSLQKYTEGIEYIEIEADSYMQLIQGAISLFPELNNLFRKISTIGPLELALLVNKKPLPIEEIFFPINSEENILVPLISGSGRVGKILAAVAIVAIVVVTGQVEILPAALPSLIGSAAAVTGATTTIAVTTIGQLALGIAASLFLSALAPSPKVNNRPPPETGGFRTDNNLFGGLQNTVDSRIPVPLNYGIMRVAGQMVSGYVKTIDHGKEDIVSVGDQFDS